MRQKGFTLIEILLVVAAIAILAGIVILAINPAKQLAETRNAQRIADVNTILNAVYQYAIDHGGDIPAVISLLAQEICRTGSSCSTEITLSDLTYQEKYLVAMPVDPSEPSGGSTTGYRIYKTSNNRVTVSAPNAELDKTIEATR